jgi:hypothetical protein
MSIFRDDAAALAAQRDALERDLRMLDAGRAHCAHQLAEVRAQLAKEHIAPCWSRPRRDAFVALALVAAGFAAAVVAQRAHRGRTIDKAASPSTLAAAEGNLVLAPSYEWEWTEKSLDASSYFSRIAITPSGCLSGGSVEGIVSMKRATTVQYRWDFSDGKMGPTTSRYLYAGENRVRFEGDLRERYGRMRLHVILPEEFLSAATTLHCDT